MWGEVYDKVFLDAPNNSDVVWLDELGSPMRVGRFKMYGFDEFGNTLVDVPNGAQPFGFTGYQRDEVAGTWYAQAREYDAGLGRMISEDRAKDGSNWYAYCGGNPLRYIDPTGLFCEDWDGSRPPRPHQFIGLPQEALAGLRDFFRMLTNTCPRAVIDRQRDSDSRFAFYNGTLVVQQNFPFANGSFAIGGVIWLSGGEDRLEVVSHERAHTTQEQILGTPMYLLVIGLPSVLSATFDSDRHLNWPWERVTDWMAGNPVRPCITTFIEPRPIPLNAYEARAQANQGRILGNEPAIPPEIPPGWFKY